MPDLLDALTGPGGGDAGTWAATPLEGLDRVATLRPVARGGTVDCDTAALAVCSNTFDGVLIRGLHLVDDIDSLFAQVRRVLRPAGTLVVVVPSMSSRSMNELRWWATLRPLRQGPWPHRSVLDSAGWLLAAADFAVIADDRVPFVLPLPDVDTVRLAVETLPAEGFWPPGMAVSVLADALTRRSGVGTMLPVPLRRLVARR